MPVMREESDRVKRALQEFSDLLALHEKKEEVSRETLRRRVILSCDLSPLEEEFFLRQTSVTHSEGG